MGIADDLRSLEELHTKGRISDQEFAAAKAAAISGSSQAMAAPARAIEPNEPARKKSNAALMIWRLVGVAILLWLLWVFLGRPSTTAIKEMANLPSDLVNDSFGLSAASWKSTPVMVPYNGSLTISVEVTRGNPVHVFLTNAVGVEKFKDTLQGTHYGGFASQKTMSFEHTARINAGQYFLVVHDPSLGILSSSSSDISLKAHIAP